MNADHRGNQQSPAKRGGKGGTTPAPQQSCDGEPLQQADDHVAGTKRGERVARQHQQMNCAHSSVTEHKGPEDPGRSAIYSYSFSSLFHLSPHPHNSATNTGCLMPFGGQTVYRSRFEDFWGRIFRADIDPGRLRSGNRKAGGRNSATFAQGDRNEGLRLFLDAMSENPDMGARHPATSALKAFQVLQQRNHGDEKQDADEVVHDESHDRFRGQQSDGVDDGDQQREGKGEQEPAKVFGVREAARQQAEDNFPGCEHGHHGAGFALQKRKAVRPGCQFRLHQQDQSDPAEEHGHHVSDDASKFHAHLPSPLPVPFEAGGIYTTVAAEGRQNTR